MKSATIEEGTISPVILTTIVEIEIPRSLHLRIGREVSRLKFSNRGKYMAECIEACVTAGEAEAETLKPQVTAAAA
jgi:hypothetical protein